MGPPFLPVRWPAFAEAKLRLRAGRRGAVLAVRLCVALGSGAVEAGDPAPASESVAGQLLVATRKMGDPRFAETVIYMVKHDASGAMGVVVNQPMGDISAAELLDQLGVDNQGVSGSIRLHYGGPVEARQGFVLHSADYVGDETLVVDGTVAMTRDREIIRDMASGAGPQRSLLAFGYAGWGAGQLESEFMTGAWITVPADEALVFDDDYDGKWRRAMARRAIEL